MLQEYHPDDGGLGGGSAVMALRAITELAALKKESEKMLEVRGLRQKSIGHRAESRGM